MERDGIREELGIDGEAGLLDIAEHGRHVAMNQVRKVGANAAAGAADRVALAALACAIEHLAAAKPIAADQFGQRAAIGRFVRLVARTGKRKKDAFGRQGTATIVFVGEIRYGQVGTGAAGG